jgi:radical SAM protein with 4Fe4S-binding SPASM domain
MLPNFIELVSKVVNKIDTIQVSIDGIGEIYELIRKKASFEVLDRNLKTLVSLCKNTKTTLMLNMVVTKENYHQMPDLVKYTNNMGISYLDFSQLNLAAVTNTPISYYSFYKSDEFLKTLDLLQDVAKLHKNVTVTYNFKNQNSFRSCPFPWSHFYVSWNGFMPPCCAKPFPKELHFGNAFTDNVKNVLNSKKYIQHRNLWYKDITPKFCEKCHFTTK